MKRASDVPPDVESVGRAPGLLFNRTGDELGEGIRLGQKRQRVARLEARACMSPRDGLELPPQLRRKRFRRPKIVEADIETRPRLARE